MISSDQCRKRIEKFSNSKLHLYISTMGLMLSSQIFFFKSVVQYLFSYVYPFSEKHNYISIPFLYMQITYNHCPISLQGHHIMFILQPWGWLLTKSNIANYHIGNWFMVVKVYAESATLFGWADNKGILHQGATVSPNNTPKDWNSVLSYQG